MRPIRVAALALLVFCCGGTLYAQTIGPCFSCATKMDWTQLTLEAICCKPQWVGHQSADCDILAQNGWAITDSRLNTCEIRQTNREGESEPLVKYCAGQLCDSGGGGGEEDPGGGDPSEGEGGGGHIDPFEPIMVHLGPGLPRLSSPQDGVIFAVSGPGDLWRLAWPLGNRTAFLVVDRNGNGQIDDMSEMFGNFTSMQAGGLASDGYAALAALDENNDGWVDGNDSAFGTLRLWLDVDRDGHSDPTELYPPTVLGVHALSVQKQSAHRRDRNGNEFLYRAVLRTSIPGMRFSWDAFLASMPLTGVSAPTPRCARPKVTPR